MVHLTAIIEGIKEKFIDYFGTRVEQYIKCWSMSKNCKFQGEGGKYCSIHGCGKVIKTNKAASFTLHMKIPWQVANARLNNRRS